MPLNPITPEQAGLGFGGILMLFGIQPRDDNVHLVGSPLYHTAVLVFSGAALSFGHTVVLMDKWTPEGMLERIEKYKVTHSHLVPTQFRRMLALPEEKRNAYDLSSMRHMIHAAAPCPIDVKRRSRLVQRRRRRPRPRLRHHLRRRAGLADFLPLRD